LKKRENEREKKQKQKYAFSDENIERVEQRRGTKKKFRTTDAKLVACWPAAPDLRQPRPASAPYY
jgi:hypothetical protein